MRLIYLFVFLFSTLFFSQTKEALETYLLNDKNAFVGKINNGAPILVNITEVDVRAFPNEIKVKGKSDVEGTICEFKGTLTLEPNSQMGNSKMSTLFYKFDFQEQKLHEHTGIFTGSLAMKTLTDNLALVVFEGNWESYSKKMRFPVYFDNNELLKTKLLELSK